MTVALTSTKSLVPAVVVFGLDDTGKAHASTFDDAEAVLAQRAAALMGMNIMPIASDSDRALAAKLPKGKIFASGKAFVPFVKASVYSEITASVPEGMKLELHEQATDVSVDDASLMRPQPEAPVSSQPTNWHDILVGSIVLSAAFPGEMDWYECVVMAVEVDDQFELRYCDWPDEPTFIRKISEIGLLHPSRQPDPPLSVG